MSLGKAAPFANLMLGAYVFMKNIGEMVETCGAPVLVETRFDFTKAPFSHSSFVNMIHWSL